MGTSAYIKIKERGRPTVKIYSHWDCYPEGMTQQLQKAMEQQGHKSLFESILHEIASTQIVVRGETPDCPDYGYILDGKPGDWKIRCVESDGEVVFDGPFNEFAVKFPSSSPYQKNL